MIHTLIDNFRINKDTRNIYIDEFYLMDTNFNKYIYSLALLNFNIFCYGDDR